MVCQFCSLPEDSSWGNYPTYEDEVSCRKQELDDCMNGARLRLNKKKDEGYSQNVSKGYDASLLDDYSECVEATWHNKLSRSDPDARDWDDPSSQEQWQTAPGGDPLLLAFGMYLPQIRAWSRRLIRSQILVLDFDRLVAQPDEMLPRVTSFMGLPALRKNKLPHENVQPYARKVDVISCETSRIMYGVYREANNHLVRGLQADHESGLAPSQEPPFEGFKTTVPCEEQEHVWTAEEEQEV